MCIAKINLFYSIFQRDIALFICALTILFSIIISFQNTVGLIVGKTTLYFNKCFTFGGSFAHGNIDFCDILQEL